MLSSPLWQEFIKFRLTINLRLKAANLSQESIQRQRQYNELILAIGEGKTDCLLATVSAPENSLGVMSYKIPNVNYFKATSNSEAVDFIFPADIPDSKFAKRAILAATNKQVDHWNDIIQKKFATTLTPIQTLTSRDELSESDDPHGFLFSMLTNDVLNQFNKNGIPPHELKLRIGDICLLQRTIDRQEKLVNNCRVKILDIKQYCIKVMTLQRPQSVHYIPRIRFKFRLPYGQSFEMIRTQFPLKLAYSLTYNKSQGQGLERALIDVTVPPFSHGHLYVALSRAEDADGIALIVDPSQVVDNSVVVQNVIYRELLLPI
jgi:hypothetical protein